MGGFKFGVTGARAFGLEKGTVPVRGHPAPDEKAPQSTKPCGAADGLTRTKSVLLQGELMAVIAHELHVLGGTIRLMAVFAVHRALMRHVGVRGHVLRAFRKRFVRHVALQALRLRRKTRGFRPHLPVHLGQGHVSRHRGGRKGKARGERKGRGKSLHHHNIVSFLLGLLRLLRRLRTGGHFGARNAAEYGGSTQLSAARVVVEEDAAGGVAGSVETGDALTVQVLNFRLGVDQGAAERGGHAALERHGIEGGLRNRMRVLVSAGRIHFAQLVGLQGFVISVHGLLHLLGGKVHLLTEFFNRIGLAVRVVEFVKLRNHAVQNRAVAVDDHPGHVVKRLLRAGAGLDDVGVVFVHEAVAGSRHLNAVAGIQDVGRIHVRRAHDRARVELIHIDELRKERFGERNVFTGGVAGTTQHHARRPTADVAVDHAGVRGEAARADADAAAAHEGLFAHRGLNFDARHGIEVVRDEADRLVFVLNFDAALGAGLQKVGHELSAARDALTHVAHDTAGASETRVGHLADLAELDADIAFEPVDARGDVVGVGTVQGLVAHALGNTHHHLVEGVGRIVIDSLFFLMTRAPAADGTQSVNGVAVGTVAFFENDDFGARVVRGDGGNEARGTGTENDGIVGAGGFPSGSRFGGETETGSTGCGGADKGGLQKTAAAHIRIRHDSFS